MGNFKEKKLYTERQKSERDSYTQNENRKIDNEESREDNPKLATTKKQRVTRNSVDFKRAREK